MSKGKILKERLINIRVDGALSHWSFMESFHSFDKGVEDSIVGTRDPVHNLKIKKSNYISFAISDSVHL